MNLSKCSPLLNAPDDASSSENASTYPPTVLVVERGSKLLRLFEALEHWPA